MKQCFIDQNVYNIDAFCWPLTGLEDWRNSKSLQLSSFDLLLMNLMGMVMYGKGVVYLTSPGPY